MNSQMEAHHQKSPAARKRVQRATPRSHLNGGKFKNGTAHHHAGKRHQKHQKEQQQIGRAEQDALAVEMPFGKGTEKSRIQKMVDEKQKEERDTQATVGIQISRELVGHQKQKVRKHQDVYENFDFLFDAHFTARFF